jgi:DNA-binding response OmpR family regulator
MTPKILVVDDSENIRNVLQMNFEWIGYDVVSAGDGDEAVRAVEREHPDLIILDVVMPRRNGYQVCRQFKSDPRTSGIPVILLTAKNQEQDVFWGRDCGADDYITKPFNTPELEAAVGRLLSGAHVAAPAAPDGVQPLMEVIEQRVREGHLVGLCTFRFDPEALTIHRQKYGEPIHHEAFARVEAEISGVLREEGFPVRVEQEADAFRVMLPCAAERIEALQAAILERANRALLELYDESDRRRGHITSRDYRSGAQRRVPLLALQAESAQMFNQD